MIIAIYPGTFDPWHDDVLNKALKLFDKVRVVKMQNKKKPVSADCYNGLLVDAVKEFNASAVIRGLRNPNDFQYEQAMQYWNEDLGLEVPTVYIICDRKLIHYSSSALREIELFRSRK